MNTFKNIFAVSLLTFTFGTVASGQVLVSLVLGDKLNTGKIEFGLDGGINYLNISNTSGAKSLFDWNLGFYFDIALKEKLFIHTGVIVKSKMGASGLAPYSIGDAGIDSVFTDGTVDRKINYFHVPFMIRYRFIDYLHVEGGIQLGLRYTAYDKFMKDVYNKEDLTFTHEIKDNFTRLDAGGVVGLGYRLQKGKGMILSIRYYHGFVDIDKVTSGNQNPSAIYICTSIPVGRGKAEKRRLEKEQGKK